MSDELPSTPPTYKTLRKFAIPQGLYRLRSGMLNNQLQRLYTGYMNGRLTKSQVNTIGQQRIKNMSNILTSDVGRWLRNFKIGVVDPKIYTEIDTWTTEKMREWERIVDDM